MKRSNECIDFMNTISLKMNQLSGKYNRIDFLKKLNIGLEISSNLLAKIDLFLIPIIINGKIGFIDKDANLVVNALFDKYTDSFESSDSLIRVCINKKWGVINSLGEFVIPVEYTTILISDDNQLFTVSKGYNVGVINDQNSIIVEFGKYVCIDGYDSGFARVKIDNKWGLINSEGGTVLEVVYDNIWNFYKKNRDSTFVERNGNKKLVFFKDLNQHSECCEHVQKYTPSYTNDYSRSVYDYDEYDNSLDVDQQSIEFWNNF